jgi:hypothetical protein
MVVEKGVNELRSFVKTLPDSISVAQMYEEMVGKYSQYKILDEDLNKFVHIAPYMSSQNWASISEEASQDLESKDIMAFLYVMFKTGQLSEYTDIDFPGYMEKSEDVLSNIPAYICLADNGEVRTFKNDEDVKSWLLYNALLRHEDEETLPPIRITFEKAGDNDAPF